METKTTLRDETIALYKARPADMKPAVVAEIIGVSVEWLRKFAAGEIPNPGVNTVETLNAYLKKAKR